MRKSSKKITLGVSAAMAMTLTGCSDSSSFTALEVETDYVKLCKNNKTDKRVPSEDCGQPSNEESSWYYVPLYHNQSVEMPKIGEKTPRGVAEKEASKKDQELKNEDGDVHLIAAEGYGLTESDENLNADYVEVCVDENGNRVDESECDVSNNSNSYNSGGFMFWYLPLFSNNSTYVPPVGSKVDTTGATRTLPQGSTSLKPPRSGIANAFNKNGKVNSSNSGKGVGGKAHSGVSRGGFGKGGGSIGG